MTGTQVSKISKVFANGSSANIKFSKPQLSQMIQSGGFLTDISSVTSTLDNIFKFAFKVKNSYSNEISNISHKKFKIIDKNLVVDARLNLIGKKMKEKFSSGIILTNNEIKDIMKVIKSLENRGTFLKGTTTKITS